MNYLRIILFTSVFHYNTAAERDLFTCIRDLSDPPTPPLTVHSAHGNCDHFSSVFGPSYSYCSDEYTFSYTMLIRAQPNQLVNSILPAGEVVEISAGDNYVVVKHDFEDIEDDMCIFEGRVESIYIKYSHVDINDDNGVPMYTEGETLIGEGGEPALIGKLVHDTPFCSNNPDRKTPHAALGVKLYAGYGLVGEGERERSRPISPTLLFDMSYGQLFFDLTNWYYGSAYVTLWHPTDDPDHHFFYVGEDAAINITGTKCQSHYNEFHILCQDTTSGPGIEGRWEHVIKLNERENIQPSFNPELMESMVHFRPLPYGHGDTMWSMTLFIPADVTGDMWEGADLSCDIRCYLDVYDVEGYSMGEFDFFGKGDGCPEEEEEE